MMEIADEHPKVPPNMTEEEEKRFINIFDLPNIKRFLEDKPDIQMFETKVLITGLLESKYKVQINIWIAEIREREVIVSEFLEKLMARFKKEEISLSAS